MHCMLLITPNTTVKNVRGDIILNLMIESFLCILFSCTIACTVLLFISPSLSQFCLQATYPDESPF